MPSPDYIAVTEQIPAAGAIVFWRLSGALNIEKLSAAWSAAGLDERELPEPPTPAVALSRAVREVGRLKRRFVHGLKGSGYALLENEQNPGKVRLEETCRVELNMVARPKVTPRDHELATDIREAFDRAVDAIESDDVRPWLIRQVYRLSGVALRPDGGTYFIPRDSLDEWRKIASAIEGASASRIFGIPAMPGAEAVDAILAAVDDEARADTDRLLSEVLADDLEPRTGALAIRNRQRGVAEIESKLARYEALLGAKVEGLREKLEEARAALCAAEIKAAQLEAQKGAA